ncbi:hypothetical protein Lal_00045197 [Lupinus albus]|nr:hypothetical protein Lal_00045197 [Lupinus albus]
MWASRSELIRHHDTFGVQQVLCLFLKVQVKNLDAFVPLVEVPHEGASSQSSGSAPWAVHHGDAKVRPCLTQQQRLSCRLSLGKVCSVEVPAWPRSAEMGSVASLGRAEASSVTRSARKDVGLRVPFSGISVALRGKFPNIRKCTLGVQPVEAKAGHG